MNNRANSYSSTRAPPPGPLRFTTSHSSDTAQTAQQRAESYAMTSYNDSYSCDYAYRVDSAGSTASMDSEKAGCVRTPSTASSGTTSTFTSCSPTSHASGLYGSGSHSSAATAQANAKKNVNVYTTCGRHSNEWLFSGWPSPFRRRDGQ